MGSLLVILSAFGFSTVGIFGKFAYQAGFTRNQMLFYRFLFALPILFCVLWIARAFPRNLKMFGSAVVLGMVGIGAEASLYFLTLETVGAALTGVFLYLYPAFVALISHFFLRQRLSRGKWVCVVLSLFGCWLTVDPFGQTLPPIGIFWGVLTGLWYGIYLMIGDRMTKDQNPLMVSSGVVLGATIAFGAFTILDWFMAPAEMRSLPFPHNEDTWMPILGLTVLASVLPFTTLYAGMKRVGAAQASVLSTLELVFTIILAALFLGETLTQIQIVGSIVVLVSVLTIQHVK